MAITTRYATNMAMQYNEVDLSNFLINPSVGSRRFLTEAEQTRLLRATETSALYFITDTSGTFYSARYRWYDSNGTLLNEYILSLSTAGVHNSIPVDWSSFYVPSGAVKMTVAIIGAVNGFSNGDFSQGTGNTFTSWTLTQPTRTNILTYSDDLTNAAWTKSDVTAAAGSITGSVGNAFKFIFYQLGAPLAGDYTLQFKAKYSTHQFIQVLWSGEGHYTNIDLINGTTSSFSGETSTIRLLDDGYYLISVSFTAVATDGHFIALVDSLASARASSTTSTSTVLIKNQMIQAGLFITPYIPTTNATVTTSLGEFLQDATGGPDGGRCIKMWVDTSGVTTRLTQNVSLVNGTDYIIRFLARVDELQGNDYLTGPSDATLIDSTEWKLYEQTFNWISGTGTFPIDFDYTNDANYGFIYLDLVSVAPINQPELSEERTFILDDSCVAYEYQLNWLNKLGGRDTWVMTGYPTETVEVNRNNQIEYSQRTNYTSPNRIYGYRENKSRKSITLTHQCKDRRTAEWLKSELIDSIDVMLLIDGVYYPCDVVPSSIVIRNTFSQDYTIRLTLRYAYDINVQTR